MPPNHEFQQLSFPHQEFASRASRWRAHPNQGLSCQTSSRQALLWQEFRPGLTCPASHYVAKVTMCASIGCRTGQPRFGPPGHPIRRSRRGGGGAAGRDGACAATASPAIPSPLPRDGDGPWPPPPPPAVRPRPPPTPWSTVAPWPPARSRLPARILRAVLGLLAGAPPVARNAFPPPERTSPHSRPGCRASRGPGPPQPKARPLDRTWSLARRFDPAWSLAWHAGRAWRKPYRWRLPSGHRRRRRHRRRASTPTRGAARPDGREDPAAREGPRRFWPKRRSLARPRAHRPRATSAGRQGSVALPARAAGPPGSARSP